MDDDRDLPPLPVRPPPGPGPTAESSRTRHSHHRSKDRNSTRDLATLLLLEQRENREVQRELSRVTEQLRLETLRANEAQSRALEVTARLKSINEARLSAVREAARANESLGLYKFQLETAQNEINRAQTVFNIVEKERYRAEVTGAKSRTAARKLNERHKIHLAREEGRRMGLQEGLEAGRLGVLRDDPAMGDVQTQSNFGGSQIDDYYDEDFESEGASLPDDYAASEELYWSSPPRNAASFHPTTLDAAPSAPPPRPRPAAAPETPPIPVPAPLSPIYVPFHDIRPIPVHNEFPHPRHEHFDVPPEGYIPQSGADSLPQVPPAHEFSRQREPATPAINGSRVAEEPGVTPSAFVRAMSPHRQHDHRSPSRHSQSVRAESVHRAPSAAGSPRPVQMPVPRTSTDIPGIERQVQNPSADRRSALSSEFFGGGSPIQAQETSASSGPIPISVLPPSRPQSYASSGQAATPSLGNNLFGPGVPVAPVIGSRASPAGSMRRSPLPDIYISAGSSGPANPPAIGTVPPGFVPSGFQVEHPAGPSGSQMPGRYTPPSQVLPSTQAADPFSIEHAGYTGDAPGNSSATSS
ncbi:hypothetical protein B0H10DRAFT_2079645 [Mycena sp. CBHHK59/15]|nr:hypothetical protein B0H10DRAFT_2079645 [Mycena sp. CBHHK59/15]